jgi:hypothetical protein
MTLRAHVALRAELIGVLVLYKADVLGHGPHPH